MKTTPDSARMPVMGYAPLAVVPWIGEPGAAGHSQAIRAVGWFQERRAAIDRRWGSGPEIAFRDAGRAQAETLLGSMWGARKALDLPRPALRPARQPR